MKRLTSPEYYGLIVQKDLDNGLFQVLTFHNSLEVKY